MSKGKRKRSKANGEGTIYKDGKGYRGQFVVGKKADGSYIRKSFSGKTKLEVTKKRDDYIASLHNGTYVDPSKITFGEWLLYWLITFKKESISPKNYDTLEYLIIMHIIPTLGHIKLQDLTTGMIQEMYNEKYRSGKLDGSGGLSPSTIKHLHETIRMALNKAVSIKLINSNPALECELNYAQRETKKQYYTLEEQKRIIKSTDPNVRSELLVLTGIMTGLRKGEIIALTWDDIDFENRRIHVNKAVTIYKNRDESSNKKYKLDVKDPKTYHSIRFVPITEELSTLLKKHKQKMIEENLSAGRSNKDYNIVFQTSKGTHHHQTNVTRTWNRILEKANVDHVGFHGTRHSYATRLLENNIDPKTVQSNIGHSTLDFTLKQYTHVTSIMVNSSRDKMSNIFNIDDILPKSQDSIIGNKPKENSLIK